MVADALGHYVSYGGVCNVGANATTVGVRLFPCARFSCTDCHWQQTKPGALNGVSQDECEPYERIPCNLLAVLLAHSDISHKCARWVSVQFAAPKAFAHAREPTQVPSYTLRATYLSGRENLSSRVSAATAQVCTAVRCLQRPCCAARALVGQQHQAHQEPPPASHFAPLATTFLGQIAVDG